MSSAEDKINSLVEKYVISVNGPIDLRSIQSKKPKGEDRVQFHVERDFTYDPKIHNTNFGLNGEFTVYGFIGDLKGGVIASSRAYLWRRTDMYSAVLYRKDINSRDIFIDTNKSYPWQSVCKGLRNFISFQAKDIPPTNQREHRSVNRISIVDVVAAENKCILSRTYKSALSPIPDYLPKPQARSWLMKEDNSEKIERPWISWKKE